MPLHLEQAPDLSDSLVERLLDFKIPETEDKPPGIAEFLIYSTISRHVRGNLFVPILPRSTWPMSGWVAVPKRSVNENRNFPRWPSDVRASGRLGVIASPSSDAGRPKGLSQLQLWGRIRASDGRHDAFSLLGGSSVGHGPPE
jgi:hypothetical protein